jgi:site-specific recombinase XerD
LNRQSRCIVEAVVTHADACLELKAHPHMIRHACGYALANKGHDTRAIQGWLGHRSITSTAVYTAPGAEPIQGFLAGVRPAIIF